MTPKPDIVSVIEAAYQVEQEEAAWLSSVLDAARPLLDRGLGLLGAIYDAADVREPRATSAAGFDLPASLDLDTVRGAFRDLPPECVRGLVTTSGCHVIPWEQRFGEVPEGTGLNSLPLIPSPFGPSDVVVLNAADPTRRGVFVSINWTRNKTPPQPARQMWDRVAAHLSSGLRLRRKLAAAGPREPPDAVVGPNGRIEHAEEAAKSPAAREALRRAALRQERARGELRRRAPERPSRR